MSYAKAVADYLLTMDETSLSAACREFERRMDNYELPLEISDAALRLRGRMSGRRAVHWRTLLNVFNEVYPNYHTDRQKRAIELRNSGRTVREIASELRVGRSTVSDWLKDG